MSTFASKFVPVLRDLATLMFAGVATMVGAAPADIEAQWNPPLIERLKLPKYCLAQFDVNYAKQAGVKAPMQICGGTMNHFCPALVMLNRAQESKYSLNTRHDMMKEAVGGIAYTYKWMPPNCPLKPDVDDAKVKADVVARFLPPRPR